MHLHILLTPELKKTMPETAKEVVNYGRIEVVFGDDTLNPMIGDNAVVEDTPENIVNWLKPYDGVPIGNGCPMMESFEIHHIKPELL